MNRMKKSLSVICSVLFLTAAHSAAAVQETITLSGTDSNTFFGLVGDPFTVTLSFDSSLAGTAYTANNVTEVVYSNANAVLTLNTGGYQMVEDIGSLVLYDNQNTYASNPYSSSLPIGDSVYTSQIIAIGGAPASLPGNAFVGNNQVNGWVVTNLYLALLNYGFPTDVFSTNGVSLNTLVNNISSFNQYNSSSGGNLSFVGAIENNGLTTVSYPQTITASAVPLPAGFSFMLAGLGFLGAVIRRRVK